MFWQKSTHLAQWLFCEKIADVIVRLDISNRVASRRFTDWILINQFDLRNAFCIARDRLVKAHFVSKFSFYFLQSWIKNLSNKCSLTTSTYATYDAQYVQRKFNI